MHPNVLERIFSETTAARAHRRNDEDATLEPLGPASVKLVDAVCSRIATRQTRAEGRLLDLMEKLDAEEERARQLEERINKADTATLEAELWLTCLTDAINAKLMYRASLRSGAR